MLPDKQYFESVLKKEILKSEQLRAILLAGISLILISVFGFLLLMFKDKLLIFIPTVTPFYYFIYIFIFLFFREVLALFIFKKVSRKGFMIPVFFRYASVIIETSVPTLLLVIIFIEYDHVFALSTPVVLLYSLFIVLSTLTLDFKISLVSGFTAALGYLILVFSWTGNESADSALHLFDQPYMYMGKAALLFLSGGLAGFVGFQLKKRILSSYEAIFETNRITNLFNQQVSQEIVDELKQNELNLEAKRKFVCVMFLDIRGFTPFVQDKEPEEIIRFQNEVFGFMIDIIRKNHGIINQFLGDGYMATFGAPVSRGNDCLNAYKSAVEILKEVHQKNIKGELPGTKLGIGLHAGDIVAGNVGTSQRKQYSITGNTVIIASRIEQLNKEYCTELLISEEVYEKILPAQEQISSLGEVKVKGREKAVNIFKVTDL